MEDTHVVVTGASGGLGGAVVEALLARGATCHVPVQEPQGTRFEWTEHERVCVTHGVSLDDEHAVLRYFAGLARVSASIHLVGGFAASPLTETSLQQFQQQWQLNVVTAFLCTREAGKRMLAQSPTPEPSHHAASSVNVRGRIVNVISRPALQPASGLVAYSVAKTAVAGLTQAAAAEWRAHGIWVNAVAPSMIDTPGNRAAMPDADPSQWPKPAEIASAIAFLASSANALTTGALLPVYGLA